MNAAGAIRLTRSFPFASPDETPVGVYPSRDVFRNYFHRIGATDPQPVTALPWNLDGGPSSDPTDPQAILRNLSITCQNWVGLDMKTKIMLIAKARTGSMMAPNGMLALTTWIEYQSIVDRIDQYCVPMRASNILNR